MKKSLILVFVVVAVLALLIGCDTKTKVVDSCGDGVVDPGEECDVTVGEASCASLGHYNNFGTLGCSQDCTFDRTGCGGRCGDNSVDAGDGEVCDGIQLSGQSCQSLGFGGGVLDCDAACQFDTDGCLNACGNSYLEGEEECDDGARQDGDGCSADCTVEYGWECDGLSPSTCVHACIDEEICDGVDNDCDGTIDNGPGMECERSSSRTCGTDEGTCVAGTEMCSETCVWTGVCSGETGPVDEICDNADNDCDGVIDGTVGGPPLMMDCTNACGPGLAECILGSSVNCTAPVPGNETCDGMDNDCDGQFDEGLAIGDGGNDDSCAQADFRTITTGGTMDVTGQAIYHGDLTGDVDYLRVDLIEMANAGCAGHPGYQECFSYYFTLTDPPDLDLEFDVIMVPSGTADAVDQCMAMDPGSTFHSTDGTVGLTFDGTCSTTDEWSFFVRVHSVSGGISCHPYQLVINVPTSIVAPTCSTYP